MNDLSRRSTVCEKHWRKILAFAYGVACYLVFLVTFFYLIGFLGNVAVPRSIDTGPDAPLGLTFCINGLLLALFGLQHSIMARAAAHPMAEAGRAR